MQRRPTNMSTIMEGRRLFSDDDDNDEDHDITAHDIPVHGTFAMKEKMSKIQNFLDELYHEDESGDLIGNVNLWEIRELALSKGGLVTAEFRQQLWVVLLGLQRQDFSGVECLVERLSMGETATLVQSSSPTTTSKSGKEEDLIQRDVGRSVLFRYERSQSPVSVLSATSDDCLGLNNHVAVLTSVLEAAVSLPLTTQQGSKPFYYQGMHDVAGVFLHNLNYNTVWTTTLLRRVMQTHLRDACRENFVQLLWFLDMFLLPLIQHVDPMIHEIFVLSEVSVSNAVLPWIITWFTHHVHDDVVSSRLVDAFVSSHPLLPFYFSVALMVHKTLRNDIIDAEIDPVSVHMAIQGLPAQMRSDWLESYEGDSTVSVQDLLDTALSIMKRLPPCKLQSLVDTESPERPISRRTLLNTCDNVSLMKAPPSWAISSSIRGQPAAFVPLVSCHRSKLASGVQEIMSTVADDWDEQLCPHLIPKKTKGRKQKFLRRVFARVGHVLLVCFRLLFVRNIGVDKENPEIRWPQGSAVECLFAMVASFQLVFYEACSVTIDMIKMLVWTGKEIMLLCTSQNRS